MPSRRAERLIEWAREFAGADRLDPSRARALVAWLDGVLLENRTVNLTAIRDPERAMILQLQDSLALAAVDLQPHRAVDLGSGNGFPGVVVAALWPECHVTLLERTLRKARALERLVGACELPGLEVARLDATQIPARRPDLCGVFDLVTARAVGRPEKVARLARPLLSPGGRLVCWLSATTPAPGGAATFDYELAAPSRRARRLAVMTPEPGPVRGERPSP